MGKVAFHKKREELVKVGLFPPIPLRTPPPRAATGEALCSSCRQKLLQIPWNGTVDILLCDAFNYEAFRRPQDTAKPPSSTRFG